MADISKIHVRYRLQTDFGDLQPVECHTAQALEWQICEWVRLSERRINSEQIKITVFWTGLPVGINYV